MPISKLSTPTQPAELIEMINEYNLLSEQDDLWRLFYLQKISQFARYCPTDPEIINWKNELMDTGLESHLQRYGVHRDASPLLQSIEFAAAVKRIKSQIEPETLFKNPEQDIYAAMRARDSVLKNNKNKPVHTDKMTDAEKNKANNEANKRNAKTLENYIQCNLAINANYEKNESLQKKIERSIHLLGLSYARLESEQGMVQQKFNEYQQSVLGDPGGNNKNFYFNIEVSDQTYKENLDTEVFGNAIDNDYFSVGKKGIETANNKPSKKMNSDVVVGEFGSKAPGTTGLVIRIENRNDLGDEQILQTHPVSEYFSEDYATIMIEAEDEEGKKVHKPFVVSELASDDLEHYAAKLQSIESSLLPVLITHIFSQISDFLNKLMDTGHYHPDIKLSNFLLDGDRVFISDKKSFLSTKTPTVCECPTTLGYAPPEFLRHINVEIENVEDRDKLYKASAYVTKVGMPEFMSYQLGEALKQFALLSNLVKSPSEDIDDHMELDDFIALCNQEDSSDEVKNIAALLSKLMHPIPEERLPIECFQILIQYLSLDPEQFADQIQETIDANDTIVHGDQPHHEPEIDDDEEILKELTVAGKPVPSFQDTMKKAVQSMRDKHQSAEPDEVSIQKKGP